ncbi:MAG: NAD(P)H-quinone oxidoreductase [Acidobacteriota bacterium]|nr:MAG: NAD(P)H-quinone oxidoreductase [Acidobacteriota bacterium]
MKAVYIREFGGPENLEIREVEDPGDPEGNEVLVRVAAAALNRADLLQRKGFYPAPEGYPDRIPGLEFAGTVVACGPSAGRFRESDRVFGITAGGAQAEFVLTREDHLAPVPSNLELVDAAAVPEAFITAHDAVWTQGGLKEGETLLIHAVGSGVGLAALQIAKAKGNRVIGTSRTAEKIEDCKKFGLDVAIDTGEDSGFSAQIGNSVDVILDLVGASYFQENLKSLAPKGRLMLVGLVGGRKAEFDLGTALTKRLTIKGTVLRSRSDEEKASATAAFARDILPLLESGSIVPNVDRVFAAEDVREAHEYLESNESFGKVVLSMGNGQ